MDDPQQQDSEYPAPKLSIITVVFNSANVLEKTINSVLNFDYPNYEYIIIDGGSDDGSLDIIHSYHSEITHWITEPDQGLYDAMNKGIGMATGEYLWFLNAGDEIAYPSGLDKLLAGRPDIVYSDTIVIDDEGIEIGMLSKLTHNNAPDNLDWEMMDKGMVVCHQSFIVSKDIAPTFNLKFRFSSDIDWVIRCLKNAHDIRRSERPLSKFMRGGLSKQHLRASMKERYLILQYHYGVFRNLRNHFFMGLRYLLTGRKSKLNI